MYIFSTRAIAFILSGHAHSLKLHVLRTVWDQPVVWDDWDNWDSVVTLGVNLPQATLYRRRRVVDNSVRWQGRIRRCLCYRNNLCHEKLYFQTV